MVDDVPTPSELVPDEVVSLFKVVSVLFADLSGLLTDRVYLLSLELRRVSNALGQMVVLGLLVAILVAIVWLVFWVGLAAAFLAVGLAWPWIVLLVLIINLGVAGWGILRVKALVLLLTLPATLRRLIDSDVLDHASAAERESERHHG